MSGVFCDQCGYGTVRRSRVRWYEIPLMLVFLRPFRCTSCGKRFWSMIFAD